MSEAQTLTDEQIRTLILSLMRSRGEEGATEAEMGAVVEWAKNVMTDYMMLQMVLDGLVAINIRADGEIAFRAPQKAAAL